MPKVVDHENRRDQIAEAAGRVMASRGVEALTLRDIAQETGFSPGILTHYFRNREELLAHTSRYLREATTRRQLDSLASAERVEDAFVRELPLSVDVRDEWKTRFQLWARSAVDPAMAEEEADSIARWRTATAELMQQRGLLSASSLSDRAADHALALSIGLCVLSFFDPRSFDADRVREIAREALS